MTDDPELRCAARMALLTGIAPSVQHGLNNLVMVMEANLDALRRSVPEGPPARQLERVQLATDRLKALTRAMLNVTRRPAVDLVAVAPGAVLLALHPLLELALGPRLQLDPAALAAPPGWVARLDRTALELGLLAHARDAAERLPRDGTVTLTLRHEDEAAVLTLLEAGEPGFPPLPDTVLDTLGASGGTAERGAEGAVVLRWRREPRSALIG